MDYRGDGRGAPTRSAGRAGGQERSWKGVNLQLEPTALALGWMWGDGEGGGVEAALQLRLDLRMALGPDSLTSRTV